MEFRKRPKILGKMMNKKKEVTNGVKARNQKKKKKH